MTYRKLQTRTELTEYCLRKVSHGVNEVNVSDEQIEDRINDALQLFFEFHSEGSQKLILPLKITENMIENGVIDFDSILNDDPEGEAEANEVWARNSLASRIISVVRVYPLTDTASATNFFDFGYQVRLNDLGDLAGGLGELAYFEQLQQYMSLSDLKLHGHPQLRFIRKENLLYIDGDLKPTGSTDVRAGKYFMVECYVHVGGDVSDLWDDMFLKEYGSALIKKQWGENLGKFENVTLPGGVTVNGQGLIDRADAEIEKIRERLKDDYDVPPAMLVG